MRRLIVNADDFVLAENVNLGIVKGHREGIVTSTSLLAGGAAAGHAAGLAKQNPALGVGVHLCLTLEAPVANPKKIPSLVKTGRLPCGPFDFMLRYATGSIKRAEIEAELRAQIERAVSLGIKPTHLDGHQHIFMMRGIFPIVLKLAGEFKIRAVRFPFGPWKRGMSLPRAAEKFILERLAGLQRKRLEASGVRHADNFFGLPETGMLSADALLRIIRYLPDGTSEIMCHPGLPDNALAKKINWGYGWELELDAVTDERVRKLVKERSIELINFGQL